jgi:hypothetical protein
MGTSSLSVSGSDAPCPPAWDDSGAVNDATFSLLSSFVVKSGCGHLRLDAFCLAVLNIEER